MESPPTWMSTREGEGDAGKTPAGRVAGALAAAFTFIFLAIESTAQEREVD
jgi:hypothetical protein